jgi:carbon monoxide dehydrogenase subunit G
VFRVSERIEIDRPASVVWPYLIAFEQVPRWERGVLEVRRVTPGAAGSGTEVSARRVFGGRTTTVTGRIIGFEDGRSATMSLRGGPIDEVFVEYAVDPANDGRSVVTYRASGDLVRPLRFLHPLAPRAGRADARANLAALKARVESGVAPDE